MSELKPSDVAAEAAVWGLIETEAKKRKDEARAWLAQHMGPDLLAVAAVANGQTVGRASYVNGKPDFKVTDDAAFTNWVAQHYPSEVDEVIVVNPAFRKKLLDELLMETEGEVIDRHGVFVHGVEYVHSKPYVTVKKSQDARATVAELLSQGRLSLDGIQALPPAPEPLDRFTQDRIASGVIDE